MTTTNPLLQFDRPIAFDAIRPEHVTPAIDELLAACRRYLDAAPRDFITVEYCMLDGVNDSLAQADALVQRVRRAGVSCKFNLIPFNPFEASGLARSPRERIAAFAERLQAAGFVTTVRKTRGDDIDAACGQLAGEVQDRTRAEQRLRRVPIAVLQPAPRA